MTGNQIKELLLKEGIKPSTVVHRKEERIKLEFKFNERIANAVKQIPKRRWSKTMQAWHIPKKKELLEQLVLSLNSTGEVAATNTIVAKTESLPISKTYLAVPAKNIQPYIQRFVDKIHLKGYSYNTLKNYRNHFIQYVRIVLPLKPVDEITKDDIEKYLRWRQRQKHYSESDQNLHINAIKFYYENVLGRDRMLFNLPRPKKPKQLPAVWAEEDVARLIKALENPKHRMMLLMAYAHGLRVSEVSSLKLADIDSKRMQIHIKAAKGKKDRIVNLSVGALEALKYYYHHYKPQVFLFENEVSGEPISTRTIQQVFQDAKKATGLIKKAGIHSLRHSYATHLHEQGIDIKYLKELLGHSSLKTTENYTHVSKRDISRIKSPFDNFKL